MLLLNISTLLQTQAWTEIYILWETHVVIEKPIIAIMDLENLSLKARAAK